MSLPPRAPVNLEDVFRRVGAQFDMTDDNDNKEATPPSDSPAAPAAAPAMHGGRGRIDRRLHEPADATHAAGQCRSRSDHLRRRAQPRRACHPRRQAGERSRKRRRPLCCRQLRGESRPPSCRASHAAEKTHRSVGDAENWPTCRPSTPSISTPANPHRPDAFQN